MILDWDLVMSREHDVKIPERIFKRNTLKNIYGLGNKGMRSIVENVNYVLKETQISSLRSKKHLMRERGN